MQKNFLHYTVLSKKREDQKLGARKIACLRAGSEIFCLQASKIPEKRRYMQLLIDGMTVTVIRKPIKNMNLRVLPPDGVIQITAPARLPQENIARFVREKRSWIERRQQILAARPAPTCPDFSDGQTVYLWGESRRLRLEPAARGRNAFLRDQDIVLQVHPGDTPAKRQALLNSFYRAQLDARIRACLPYWEGKTGLHPASVQIKNMKTRWGTCNTAAKRIWLNLQLVKQPPVCLDYVLAHELTHLLHPDHGNGFWAFLLRVMPDCKAVRKALNETPFL